MNTSNNAIISATHLPTGSTEIRYFIGAQEKRLSPDLTARMQTIYAHFVTEITNAGISFNPQDLVIHGSMRKIQTAADTMTSEHDRRFTSLFDQWDQIRKEIRSELGQTIHDFKDLSTYSAPPIKTSFFEKIIELFKKQKKQGNSNE